MRTIVDHLNERPGYQNKLFGRRRTRTPLDEPDRALGHLISGESRAEVEQLNQFPILRATERTGIQIKVEATIFASEPPRFSVRCESVLRTCLLSLDQGLT